MARNLRDQEYITLARALTKQTWEGIRGLLALQAEWNALDYLNNLENGTGDNAGILAAEVGAVVFDTANALEAVLLAGNATNMSRLL